MRLGLLLPLVTVFATTARGETVVRLASAAPEGTAWARELRNVGRDVEMATGGEVKVKWYFGGIAGDELQAGERIRRGQLDGAASGGMLCMRLAPSMRVLRIFGMFQNRDESAYVLGRLKPILDKEFSAQGFSNLVEVGLGPDVLFTREPVQNMADLKRARFWFWDLDEVHREQLPLLGIHGVPRPLTDAARAFERGEVDGFFGLPTAALAFQWVNQVRYVTDLRLGFLSGCLIVANRSFDSLPLAGQQAFRAAAAKLQARVEDMGRQQDAALLNGLFARQGMKPVPPSRTFRAEFFAAARVAREKLGDKIVPRALI